MSADKDKYDSVVRENSTDLYSDPDVESMTPDQAKQTISDIMSQEKMSPVKEEFGRIPFYTVFSSTASFFLAEWALKRGKFPATSRPNFVRLTGFLTGGLIGLQFGIWRLKSKYEQADPDHTIRKRLKLLYAKKKEKINTE